MLCCVCVSVCVGLSVHLTARHTVLLAFCLLQPRGSLSFFERVSHTHSKRGRERQRQRRPLLGPAPLSAGFLLLCLFCESPSFSPLFNQHGSSLSCSLGSVCVCVCVCVCVRLSLFLPPAGSLSVSKAVVESAWALGAGGGKSSGAPPCFPSRSGLSVPTVHLSASVNSGSLPRRWLFIPLPRLPSTGSLSASLLPPHSAFCPSPGLLLLPPRLFQMCPCLTLSHATCFPLSLLLSGSASSRALCLCV